mmetsp:Transcript_29432/g.85142  ORF Transcript_29432/g.85142 Transcript_29432/m.85142 type:complete len:138 (-) Transcript_29432:315-728(-)
MLLLSGSVIFEPPRSFAATQFFDAPLKRRNLIVRFTDATDLYEKIQWFRRHDDVARRLAAAMHKIGWHCLTHESVRQSLVMLLKRLGALHEPTVGKARRPGKRLDDDIRCVIGEGTPLHAAMDGFGEAADECYLAAL